MMIVGVLANDNPQGLLLASRLVGYAQIRVSIGGRLGRLLEDGWKLMAENGNGQLVHIPTRVMRRGEDNSTKQEEALSGPNVLWLCDWKDTATGWYSLSDCHLLLQTSKATDSKTVAMWLAEVCKDDAVIISLQSGLHNARELRSVFGHRGGTGIPEDMPLVATMASRKAAGSIDTNDGALSRRESASSIYSEFSGLEIDEAVDPSERSASPLPPGLMSGLPSPTSSDGSGHRDLRKAIQSSRDDRDDDTDRSPDSHSSSAQKRLQETTNNNAVSPVALRSRDTASPAQDENDAGKTVASPVANSKKPQSVLLAGLLGFGACALVDEPTKTLTCMATHQGAIVLERLTKTNALQALGRVMLLERAKFKVRYRANEETNNWLWGDVVWRSFETYAAALRMAQPDTSKSLYALLSDSDVTHRRVYAGLLDEALAALRWQKVELMDPVSSPFGLSFRATRSLLLLPKPLFKICLRLVLALRFPQQASVRPDSPYCDSTTVHRYMAPFLNGEVVRIGFEGEVQTPLNQEVLEMLSMVSRQQATAPSPGGKPLQIKTPLPPLYSMSFSLLVVSCIVLLLAVFVQFVIFVVDVTFFW